MEFILLLVLIGQNFVLCINKLADGASEQSIKRAKRDGFSCDGNQFIDWTIFSIVFAVQLWN